MLRIVVLGAGAIGSFFGGLLSKKHDVTLIGRRPHVEAVRKNGLRIEGKTELLVHPYTVEGIEDVESADLLMVSVKSYDTQKALEGARKVARKATLLSLQNGLGNAEILASFSKRVIAGVTTIGITYKEPGVVRHAGLGRTVIGNYSGVDEEFLHEVARAFTEAGITTEVRQDITAEIWKKVAVNVGINPLTAILGIPNGQILKVRELEAISDAACGEAIAVANSCGIGLQADIIERMKEVIHLTADNRSSMLQDVERRKKTEIDSLCGEIVRIGREKGIETPVNLILLAIVKAVEKAYGI